MYIYTYVHIYLHPAKRTATHSSTLKVKNTILKTRTRRRTLTAGSPSSMSPAIDTTTTNVSPVCCSVLQCVAVFYNESLFNAPCYRYHHNKCISTMCCSVL